MWLANRHVESSTAQRTFSRVKDVPHRRVGLVLGCSPFVAGGRRNLYFQHRMDAAARLYKANRVNKLLVSGDNGTRQYNEPAAMKAALLQRGVARADIIVDYAGFRTLDSVVRAREVFGVSSMTIISQAFHNHRAVYIAKHYGFDTCAYNARDVNPRSIRTEVRESLARLRMLADVHLLRTAPRFLGAKQPIYPPESD